MDQSSEDATHGLDTERKGSNVEKEDILDISGQNGALDGSTDRNGLVWVNTTVWLLVEEVLNGLPDLGDTAGSANHEHLVDLVFREGGILEACLEWLESLVHLRLDKALELGTCHLHIQMLRSTVVEGKIGNADCRLRCRRKLDLGLFCGFTAPLEGTLVLHDVDTALRLELTYEEVLHLEIEVLTSKCGISVRGFDFEDTT